MIKYNLYIHGVPVGHEVWGGNTKEEDAYIEQFYDLKTKETTILKIEIVEGVSYYSYIKKNNFTNAEGRPGSYLGITISFFNLICTNVNILYHILDAIYKNVFEGTIVKETDGGYTFLVRELSTVKYKGYVLLDYVRLVLDKKIGELLTNNFIQIQANVTTRGLVQFSLSEVDSPIFRDTMLTKQIVVSSEIPPAINAYHALHAKISPLEEENGRLARLVANFKESSSNFQKEIIKLENDLINAREQEGQKLTELRRQLQESEKQKLALETKDRGILEVLKSMENTFENISPLLKNQSLAPPKKTNKPKNKITLKLSYVNLVLLLCTLRVCIFILFSPKRNVVSNGNNSATTSACIFDNNVDTGIPTDDANSSPQDTGSSHSQISENYTIDIDGYTGNGPIDGSKAYTLKIKGHAEVVGTWQVIDDTIQKPLPDNVLNCEKLKVKSKKIKVEYVVNKNVVSSRILKVNYDG